MTFISDLCEQLQLLVGYCRLYDEGTTAHAKSIAGRISVIMEMLSSRDGADFVAGDKQLLLSNTFRPLPHAKAYGHHPLAILSVSARGDGSEASARFQPMFANSEGPIAQSFIALSTWKNEVVISVRNLVLTRYRLYHQMRNKDGGSHPRSDPDPSYSAASDPIGLGLRAIGSYGGLPYDPPAHFATMRQMAYELLSSPRLQSVLR